MSEQKYYLVYEWAGADERDWKIVGPFLKEGDREKFWHEFGQRNEWNHPLPGWGVMGWEYAGGIEGRVSGVLAGSPMDLVNLHPKTAEEMQAAQERVAFLVQLGFVPTDAVLAMKVPEPKQSSILNQQAKATTAKMWMRHVDQQMERRGFFSVDIVK